MAKILDKKSDKYAGEAKVFDCLEKNLPDSIIGYYNREVNGHEFDFCILVKNLGLMIIEVKGWNAEHIVAVKSPNEIYLKDYPNAVSSPKKQANAYRFALLNMLNSHYGINPVIVSCVAYPFISETEYANKGLNIVSEPEVTLFAEDLVSEQKLSAKLGVVFKQNKVQHADKTSGIVYDTIRKHFENAVTVKTEELENNYSELRIYGKGLTFSDVEVVVKNYTSGIKQIDLCKLTSALCNPYNTIYLYDLIYSNNVNIKFSPLNLVNKDEEER